MRSPVFQYYMYKKEEYMCTSRENSLYIHKFEVYRKATDDKGLGEAN